MEFDMLKTPKGRYVTYLWTWPQDILMWLFWILPFWAFWGEKLRFEEGSLAFNLKENSWPARTWYKRWGGTSIGHALMYNHHVRNSPTQLHRITVHEQHHVKQFEAVSFTAFVTAWIPFVVLAAYGHWVPATLVGLCVWVLGHTLHGLGNFIVAALLGGKAYGDSYHEKSAYDTDYRYQLTGQRDNPR